MEMVNNISIIRNVKLSREPTGLGELLQSDESKQHDGRVGLRALEDEGQKKKAEIIQFVDPSHLTNLTARQTKTSDQIQISVANKRKLKLISF